MTIAHSIGASRLEAFFSDLHDGYVGTDTEWWFGSEYIFQHHNFNRLVMWPSGGVISAPKLGAQGAATDAGGVDDRVFSRMPSIVVALWAESYEQAEHRLHSLLVALDNLISQADILVANINESWPMNEGQDLSTNGVAVVLSFDLAIDVLARDTEITAYDVAVSPTPPRPAIGDGGPTEAVTDVDINTPDEDDVPTKSLPDVE